MCQTCRGSLLYCPCIDVTDCDHAGVTSENVAAKYGVSRDTQDKFAAQSHARMAAAQQAGKFDREIVPVATKLKVLLSMTCASRACGCGKCLNLSHVSHWHAACARAGACHWRQCCHECMASCVQDPKSGEEHDVVISRDDGVRPGTTAASLAKLRPVFKKDGSTTAGNSSQVHSLPCVVTVTSHIPASLCNKCSACSEELVAACFVLERQVFLYHQSLHAQATSCRGCLLFSDVRLLPAGERRRGGVAADDAAGGAAAGAAHPRHLARLLRRRRAPRDHG